MAGSAQQIIEELKATLAAASDADLARLLGVDKSTVASWKARGSVPKRYSRLLDASTQRSSGLPEGWGSLELEAFTVALFRFTVVKAKIVLHVEPRELITLAAFWGAAFWPFVEIARQDILALIDDGVANVHDAGLILLSEDAADREKTVAREDTFSRSRLKSVLNDETSRARIDALRDPKEGA